MDVAVGDLIAGAPIDTVEVREIHKLTQIRIIECSYGDSNIYASACINITFNSNFHWALVCENLALNESNSS